MDKTLKAELTKCAKDAWMRRRRWVASLGLTLFEPIAQEKVSEIKAAFRPQIEAVMVKLAAMPKNELNKAFIYDYLTVDVKVNESDERKTTFAFETFDNVYSTRQVNGRQIKTLLPVDEIVSGMPIWRRYKDGNRLAIAENEDGTHCLIDYAEIERSGVKPDGKNPGRQVPCREFVKTVLDELDRYFTTGYSVVSMYRPVYLGATELEPYLVLRKTA